MYNTSKLRGRIIEKFGSVDSFSKHATLTRQSISDSLNGKRTLNQNDIVEWMGLLDIKESELFDYFFAPKVDKMEQAE